MRKNHERNRTKSARLCSILVLLLCVRPSPADAQSVNALCTVSVLNQTAYVQADGTWLIPNIPTNMGPVRARVTCMEDGDTVSGESELFTIATDRQNSIPVISLGSTTPAPEKLDLEAPRSTLTSAGDAVRLTATAELADGTSRDVSSAAAGIVYVSTNPEVAAVSADGLVQARASGRVLITALYDGTIDTLPLEVITSADSDGDGLPDDFEVRNGLDPNDPVDALEDPDRDGLITRDELDLGTDPQNPDSDGDGLADGDEVERTGTNPALFDTDGDGLSDGLELETGSDPLDPTSFNLAAALVAFEVTPSQLNLVADAILPEASRQLTVTGTLRDGTAIDLTARSRGTAYASSDLLVCNFGAEDGVVFAGNDGTCTVTASNSGFSDSATITVSTFAPTARAVLPLPGFANNVDVAGDRAFVAAGSAGLLVIDVSVRTAPRVAASLALPGNANDVKVRDGLAYVAAGAAGLRIVDVREPGIPMLSGFVDTPGDARDVALAGDLAFVADGGAGVQIVDVSDPGSPVLLGSFNTPGTGKGVDVSDDGRLALVADGAAGLQVLDVSDPASPVLLGSVATADARDVDVVGATSWVADFTGGLTSVDLSAPAAPRILASVARELGGIPMDVVVTAAAGPFALVADVFFVNAVPIVEVSDAANPLPRTPLDFSAIDDFNGTGLAADGNFVYLTASKQIVENGSSGETRLYVGQYLGFEDDGGVAPSVRLVSPLPDTSVPEGGAIRLEAQATDDVGVFVVRLLADGEVILEDDNPPYVIELTAPPAPAVLTFSAVALDFAGNRGEAEPVAVRVVGRETTSVVGSVVDGEATPLEGAAVFTERGGRGLTEAAGLFRLDDVPADEGDLVVFAAGEREGEALRGRSGALAPVAGGLTDAGEIVATPLGGYPGRRYLLSPDKNSSGTVDTLATGDFDGDGRLDVAAWVSGNRIAVLYDDGGGALAPVVELETAVVPSRVAAADLDGDGLSDLIALNRLSDDLSVFLARPAGGFAPERRFAAGDEPWGVAVGDLNRDAVPDLAVLNRLSSDVTVLLGLGGGEYLPGPILAAGPQPVAIVAVDLDNDGVSDLAVADRNQSAVWVYFGRGDGTMEPVVNVALPLWSTHVVAADVDLDRHLDLVFLGVAPSSSSPRLAVLPGRGDRTFAAPLEALLVSTVAKALALAVADVDRDGFPDAVISAEDSGRRPFVKTLRGDGSGFFTWQNDFETYTGPYRVLDLADVDGDGFVDLLTGSAGGVTVYRGGDPEGFVSYRRTGLRGLFVVGDLNLDGLQDLLVQQGSTFNAVLQAYLGRPDGGFDTPPRVSETNPARQLLLADVDRDGVPDAVALASARFSTAEEVAVYLGRGDGTFAPGVARPIPHARRGVLGDFDGDGFPDLATTRALTDEVDVFFNQGGGAFSAPTSLSVGVDPSELAAADFDGNGGLDLAVVNAGSNDLSILLNRGGGVFDAELRASAGPFLARLGVLDADRDGRPDLVVRDTFPEQIAVLLGNGDGTFREGQRLTAGREVDALIVADVDLDGIDDVVCMNRSTQDVSVYRGLGDGTFEDEKRYLAGGDVTSTAVADIDHDGRPDLVVFASEIHFLLRK